VVLAAASTAILTAAPARRDALPTRVPGTLTVGVDIGNIGLAEGTIVHGQITHASGFEIDLARALAVKLGLELRLVEEPFAQTFTPGPKPFDVALSHVTITAARAKAVDFSAPYFVVGKGVLMAPGAPAPQSLGALRKLRICAQAGTTSMSYIQTTLHPLPAPHYFPAPLDALLAVSDGYCEAMIADLEILVAARNAEPDLYGPIAGQIATNERYGAVFQKGSKLRVPAGAALQSLARSGAIARLADQWFGNGWNKVPVLR
jgi:polar amino acid transport system substrate-binding protein